MNCILCTQDSASLLWEKPEEDRHYYHCDACGLVFLNPSEHPNTAECRSRLQHHNNSPESAGYVEFLDPAVQLVTEYCSPGQRGLDFGCGPGPTLSQLLERKGYSMQDYDPLFYPQQELLKTDYEFVTATEVVEHFSTPRIDFQSIDQMLATHGGHFVAMTQVLVNVQEFPNWWYHKDFTHLCFYQKQTLEWIAQWLGWELLAQKKNAFCFRVECKR